jgi:uncharacterized membrane-anchored protein
VTFALLLGALLIAIVHGRTVEAIIIGILTVPSLVFVVAWVTGRLR